MSDGKITLGLIGSSNKENEKRTAIHPIHFPNFDAETKKYVFCEKGFGKTFGIPDSEIAPLVAGMYERDEMFKRCEAVQIFKPSPPDFEFFEPDQVLWGAVHTVQNPDIVQVGIDKKMTFLAMENMWLWRGDKKGEWIYNTASELAGYCSTLQACQLLGIKGWYDQPKKCAIISFGAVGRGACQVLQALDFDDITVFTGRDPIGVLCKIPGIKHGRYIRDPEDENRCLLVKEDGTTMPFGEHLKDYDIIVNAIFQDTDRPMMFMDDEHVNAMKRRSLIVDVSCDRGMGWTFARPTTFYEPTFEVANGVVFYGVDHSPSLLHTTASIEHSKANWRYVKPFVDGRASWEAEPTLGRSIEMDRGVIVNPKILSYQNREAEYPHNVIKG